MRILVLNYEYPPVGGGAAYVSQEINKRYLKQGHEVSVVTMSYGDLPAKEIEGGLTIFRVKSIRSRQEICHPHELLSYVISARRFLKKYLKEKNHDICHCHFLVPTGLIAIWTKKKFGLKYVITIHGSDVPGYNPDRFRFLHLFTGSVISKILRQSSGLVSPSRYLGDLLKKSAKSTDWRISYIPNGIDLGSFRPEHKEGYILTSGRLLHRKGFHLLIKAVSQENVGFPIHICGDGPMRSELEALAQNSATQIIFHGWMDNRSAEYRRLLGAASIYALISSRENSSVSLLEAMASGCAVVTLGRTGIKEMIGDCGILIEQPKVEQIFQSLMLLIKDPVSCEKWGIKARKRAQEFYDWEKIGQSYLKVLEQIKI